MADPFDPPQAFGVDLTYRDSPTHEMPVNALVLKYGDIDQLINNMRNYEWRKRKSLGLPPKRSVRFLVAGEYGGLKGRAHWHCLFWVRGGKLELPPFGTRQNWLFWPHGFAWFKETNVQNIRYAVKYALKTIETNPGSEDAYGATIKANYSKRPPLGDAYFANLAMRYVEAGLPIHDSGYYFNDISSSWSNFGKKDKYGKAVKPEPWRYYLTHRSLERYLARYVEGWASRYGGLPPLTEFLVEKYFDPLAKAEETLDPASLARDLERRRSRDPLRSSPRGERVPSEVRVPVVDIRHIATLLLSGGGVAAGYSDGTLSIGFGVGDPLRSICRDAWDAQALAAVCGLPVAECVRVGDWFRTRAVPLLDAADVRRPVMGRVDLDP